MSVPAVGTGARLDTCAACTAALGHDQRYCLHCGEPRPGAARPMPASLRPPVAAPRALARAEVREGPSIAAVLAGLACLLIAMGVGVLIGRGAGEPVVQAPVTVAAAGTPVAPPATASFTSDWPAGSDGWTVALALLPSATTTPAAVVEAKTAASAKGATAVGALDSASYPSLTAGSYVVYSGVFDTKAAATTALAPLAAGFPDARVVRVGKDAAVPAAGSSSAPPTSKSSSTKKSTAAAPDAGSGDTTKEFEKSKKAPKTVGTGGTPPPKDNKPAAGGGPSEEIG